MFPPVPLTMCSKVLQPAPKTHRGALKFKFFIIFRVCYCKTQFRTVKTSKFTPHWLFCRLPCVFISLWFNIWLRMIVIVRLFKKLFSFIKLDFQMLQYRDHVKSRLWREMQIVYVTNMSQSDTAYEMIEALESGPLILVTMKCHFPPTCLPYFTVHVFVS